MRVLKTILFILLILALVMLILHFLAPKEYSVERTISIDAPPGAVWKEVGTLGAMQEWSPWAEADPNMETTIHGTDGEVGAYSHWEGPTSGVGEQRIVAVDRRKSIDTELEFMEPSYMAGKAKAGITLVENAAGGTDVTWSMSGDQKFPMRSFSMIPGMDMDSQVGPSYDKGLSNLQNRIAETKKEMEASKKAVANSAVQVSDIKKGERIFVVKREKVAIDKVSDFYASNLPSIYTAIGAAGAQPAGQPSGIFYDWDIESGTTDMCAAIPVTDSKIRIEGYETITMPASNVLHVAHYGDYASTGVAHDAIEKYMKAHGMIASGPAQEEYVTDPTEEPDPKKWLTNIYYPYQ